MDRLDWKRIWRAPIRGDLVVACCMTILCLGSLVWGGVFWYLTVPSVAVPALAGLPLEEARDEASSRGLTVEDTRWVYHPVVPAGDVIDQSIDPGARVRAGRQIGLTVSRGQNLVPVPFLRTRPISLAAASLDMLQLQMQVAEAVHDEWVNAGGISSQDPRPGTLVPVDSVVTVVVSRGPPPTRHQGSALARHRSTMPD